MTLTDYSKYIGQMKQPLQQPDIDRPSMYIATDGLKQELDLILLTPGTFLHAYKYIASFNAVCVRLFFPTLRPEFISDVFNLYMLLKDKVAIKWVFPDIYDHVSFSEGEIKTSSYQNQFSSDTTITYIENTEIEGVYDIIVRTQMGTNYFSFYLDEKGARKLCNNSEYTLIHVPKSSTLYGGLTYDSIIQLNRSYRRKLVPYDFASVAELYEYHGATVPESERNET